MSDVEILGSSSNGNCILWNNILLDCGVSYKKVEKIEKKIKLIFISHL